MRSSRANPVFVSYRRTERGFAGRLADSLENRLGSRFAFRDVVGISPGDRFDEVLEHRVRGAKVVLVLIGPSWLGELEERLANEAKDYHHWEIATALDEGKRVVPVILPGAKWSEIESTEILPDDMVELKECQAFEMHDASWDNDVDQLIDTGIGRPYRLLWPVVRTVSVSILTIPIVWLVLTTFAPGSDVALFRNVILIVVTAYWLFEIFLAYRHHRWLTSFRSRGRMAASHVTPASRATR